MKIQYRKSFVKTLRHSMIRKDSRSYYLQQQTQSINFRILIYFRPQYYSELLQQSNSRFHNQHYTENSEYDSSKASNQTETIDPLLVSSVKETDPFIEDYVTWFIQQIIRKGDVSFLPKTNSRPNSESFSLSTSANFLRKNHFRIVFVLPSILSLFLMNRFRMSCHPGITKKTSLFSLFSYSAFYLIKQNKLQNFPAKSNRFFEKNVTPSFFTTS